MPEDLDLKRDQLDSVIEVHARISEEELLRAFQSFDDFLRYQGMTWDHQSEDWLPWPIAGNEEMHPGLISGFEQPWARWLERQTGILWMAKGGQIRNSHRMVKFFHYRMLTRAGRKIGVVSFDKSAADDQILQRTWESWLTMTPWADEVEGHKERRIKINLPFKRKYRLGQEEKAVSSFDVIWRVSEDKIIIPQLNSSLEIASKAMGYGWTSFFIDEAGYQHGIMDKALREIWPRVSQKGLLMMASTIPNLEEFPAGEAFINRIYCNDPESRRKGYDPDPQPLFNKCRWFPEECREYLTHHETLEGHPVVCLWSPADWWKLPPEKLETVIEREDYPEPEQPQYRDWWDKYIVKPKGYGRLEHLGEHEAVVSGSEWLPNFDPDRHVLDRNPKIQNHRSAQELETARRLLRPNRHFPVVQSWDPGATSVCLWFQVYGRRVNIMRELESTRNSMRETIEHAYSIQQNEYHDYRLVGTGDPQMGAERKALAGLEDWSKEWESKHGARYEPVRSRKMRGREVVMNKLDDIVQGFPLLVVHPRCERLIKAMRVAQFHETSTGVVKEDVQQGTWYEHFIDALHYCCLFADEYGGTEMAGEGGLYGDGPLRRKKRRKFHLKFGGGNSGGRSPRKLLTGGD